MICQYNILKENVYFNILYRLGNFCFVFLFINKFFQINMYKNILFIKIKYSFMDLCFPIYNI
ncbi:hypothetical protein PFAG_03212 [Plasmodium falciparum Santa Lucia]|uniref:Uncharacterized protein n=4 Tax=Plasmodium falciparum TaxID=5833 RepID=W4IRZ2_PLAFP|nr:hypothetical protein PFMALIP_03196 [Plasmodium falciparum MaliPS096_E11]ETW52748.1 hypothetical protein PFUGPA_05055 [Plasmodium falciparum Palo Alto/Uganda]EUT84120.1 hypothetical protein PFAG_03212 [Plasmodium falciparum Santa Lucia]EWC76026.1 hypothetical protein C923_03310 [Plasmodium falciparum UGT5.1]